MAKTDKKKPTNRLAPEAGPTQPAAAYPAEPGELSAQQQRLKRAVLGADALTWSIPPAPSPKPATQAELANSCSASNTAPQAAAPPSSPMVKVTFVLLEPDAGRVSLSGEFNGWSVDATPMKRHDGGHWETTVELPPGRYQYKFVFDGQWIPDPLAHENVWNEHGTLNSVIEVGLRQGENLGAATH